MRGTRAAVRDGDHSSRHLSHPKAWNRVASWTSSASRENDAANAGGGVSSRKTHRRGVRYCRFLELAWSAAVVGQALTVELGGTEREMGDADYGWLQPNL